MKNKNYGSTGVIWLSCLINAESDESDQELDRSTNATIFFIKPEITSKPIETAFTTSIRFEFWLVHWIVRVVSDNIHHWFIGNNLSWYGTLKYGDVHEKFDFLKIEA